jgi:hypothetical protein
MNVKQAIQEVNVLLTRMDERFAAAQKVCGIKPNLRLAPDRIADAGATVMELADLLSQLEAVGLRHPPDVINRVRDRYARLHQMSVELVECEHIVKVRSAAERPQTTLN